MRTTAFILLILGLGLAGCATMPDIPMSGTTVAQGKLKADVFRMLPSYAAATTGCKERITHIHTKIVQAPKATASDARGRLTQGTIRERWLLTLCGRKEPVFVTFTPDGKGGSYISFSRKPKGKPASGGN